MPRFADIPQLPNPHYRVDIPWDQLEAWLSRIGRVNLDPDFQRAHVWTEEQRSAYVEWCLRGGQSGKEIHFNAPDWPNDMDAEMVIVDGKQRLEAVRRFMRNEVRAFGFLLRDFTDGMRWSFQSSFSVRICNLKTRAEVLRWYLDFNAGGTPHRAEEIEKVRRLLAQEEE